MQTWRITLTALLILPNQAGILAQNQTKRAIVQTTISTRLQLRAWVETADPRIGSPVVVAFQLKNTSTSVAYVQEISTELDYELTVTDQAGREVSRTHHGRHLAEDERGGSAQAQELMPGQALEGSIDVCAIYDFKKPGKYYARLSRVVLPAGTLVKPIEKAFSNPVVFTISGNEAPK